MVPDTNQGEEEALIDEALRTPLRASPDEGIAPTVVGRLEWFYDRIERFQVATFTGNILERGERIMVSEFLSSLPWRSFT
jgi:hypothetical protein